MIDQRLDEAFEILKNPYPITSAPDEWSAFGQYVSSKLRGYSKQTSSIVQHLINNTLFEADMGKHAANSYQFLQPSQHFPYQSSPSSSTYFTQNSYSSSTSSQTTPVISFSPQTPGPSYMVLSPVPPNNITTESSEYNIGNSILQENTNSDSSSFYNQYDHNIV